MGVFAGAFFIGRSELKLRAFDLLCKWGRMWRMLLPLILTEGFLPHCISRHFLAMENLMRSTFWAHKIVCLGMQATKHFWTHRIQRLLKRKPGFGSQINFFSQTEQKNNHKTMFDCTGQLVNNLTAFHLMVALVIILYGSCIWQITISLWKWSLENNTWHFKVPWSIYANEQMWDNYIQLDGVNLVKRAFTLRSLILVFQYPMALLIKFSVFKMKIACKNI